MNSAVENCSCPHLCNWKTGRSMKEKKGYSS